MPPKHHLHGHLRGSNSWGDSVGDFSLQQSQYQSRRGRKNKEAIARKKKSDELNWNKRGYYKAKNGFWKKYTVCTLPQKEEKA